MAWIVLQQMQKQLPYISPWRRKMTGWKTIVSLAAFAGCASLHPAASRDLAVGHWKGEIDRGGWLQPLAFEIEKDGNSYRGDWASGSGGPGRPFAKRRGTRGLLSR